MPEAVLDYSALAKLTERQQLQYLLSMTSSSAERAPLADLKPNVDLQVTVSKPAKAVLTTVDVCADDHDLGGDIEVSLALVDPLLPSVEERHALKGFKSIADELLPYMRHGSLVRTAPPQCHSSPTRPPQAAALACSCAAAALTRRSGRNGRLLRCGREARPKPPLTQRVFDRHQA